MECQGFYVQPHLVCDLTKLNVLRGEHDMRQDSNGNYLPQSPPLIYKSLLLPTYNKLSAYCSWKPDPSCMYKEVLSPSTGEITHSIHVPSFCLVPRCPQKITLDETKGILLVPIGQNRHDSGRFFSCFSTNQKSHIRRQTCFNTHWKHPRPLQIKLNFMVCMLSGSC